MNTTLTIKIEKKLRDDAKKTAKELGLPLTTAVNALVRQFVRDKEISLRSHVPNAETRRALAEIVERKDLESFDSVSEWRAAMQPH